MPQCALEGFKILTEQDQQWKIGSKCNNQCTVTYRGQMPHDYLYRLRKKYQMPTLFYNKKASTRKGIERDFFNLIKTTSEIFTLTLYKVLKASCVPLNTRNNWKMLSFATSIQYLTESSTSGN